MGDRLTIRGGSHLRKQGFRGIAGESRLRPTFVAPDVTTRYYSVEPKDGGYVSAIVVINPKGVIKVFSLAPNGDYYMWGCRVSGVDEITFYPHPAYKGDGTDDPCIVFEPGVKAARMYAQPTKSFTFMNEPTLSLPTGAQ